MSSNALVIATLPRFNATKPVGSVMATARCARRTQPRSLVFYCLCLCLVVPPTSAVKAFCVQGDPSCAGGFASIGPTRKELWMQEKIRGQAINGMQFKINSSVNPALNASQLILFGSGVSADVVELNSTISAQDPVRKIASWHDNETLKSLNDDGTLCANDPTGLNTINPC